MHNENKNMNQDVCSLIDLSQIGVKICCKGL